MAEQLRIVVRSDDSGYDYKEALKADLAAETIAPHHSPAGHDDRWLCRSDRRRLS